MTSRRRRSRRERPTEERLRVREKEKRPGGGPGRIQEPSQREVLGLAELAAGGDQDRAEPEFTCLVVINRLVKLGIGFGMERPFHRAKRALTLAKT